MTQLTTISVVDQCYLLLYLSSSSLLSFALWVQGQQMKISIVLSSYFTLSLSQTSRLNRKKSGRLTWTQTKTGGKTRGADKFGFVAAGTHNEAMIKLLSMVCVCVCAGVLCFRCEDVDKLSDPGKQQSAPRSIYDFEPEQNSRSQVGAHTQSKIQHRPWYQIKSGRR